MDDFNRHTHWENIYHSKDLKAFSWYQEHPDISLKIIRDNFPNTDARIIDIGGGDSLLADHLVALGYTNISVLDISETAVERAKARLGDKASQIKWIVSDIIDFKPSETYDFWHDRATFHFLLQEKEIQRYLSTAHQAMADGGKLLLGTFSENGPQKCSGIPVTRYDATQLTQLFSKHFFRENCFKLNHQTPTQAVQEFTFCLFSKAQD